MSKQTKNGATGEQRTAKLFNKRGYWAHVLAKTQDGSQPFDVIAVKRNENGTTVWMVDSKWINDQKASFTFTRVEANQLSSMEYAIRFAGIDERNVGFVLFFERDEDNPKFLSFTTLEDEMGRGKKSFNMAELPDFISELDNRNVDK